MINGLREYALTSQVPTSMLNSTNHLFNTFQRNPVYARTIIDFLYRENWGNTLTTEIAGLSTFTTTSKYYKWKRGVDSLPLAILVGSWADPSGMVPLINTDYPLQADAVGYIDLEGSLFGVGMKIGKQDTFSQYQLWLLDDGSYVNETTKRYKVKLIGTSTMYLPHEELNVNSKWFFMGGLMEDEYSDNGSSMDYLFQTFDMAAQATQFRFKKQFSYDFYVNSMKDLRTGKAQAFYYIDPDTKKEVATWLDATTVQFLGMIKRAEDLQYRFGISNVNADGSVNNRGNSSQIATSSAGLEQYYLHGDMRLYDPATFSVKNFINRYVQENLGKKNPTNAKLVLSAGVSGYAMLQELIRKEYGYTSLAFMQNNQNPAYQWNDKEGSVMLRNAQIEGVKDLLGVEVKLVLDYSKDDSSHYTKKNSKGELLKSYEIDIMNTSEVEGMQGGNQALVNNVQKVRVEGYDPIFGVQAGLGFKWGGATNPIAGISGFNISSPVPASTIHYMWTGGLVVWKPELLKRMSPVGLYSN